MNKEQRNALILDHMKDKGYSGSKTEKASRKLLKDQLDRDRKEGRDTMQDILYAFAQTLDTTDKEDQIAVMVGDLNDMEQIIQMLREKLLHAEQERDSYKNKAIYINNANNTHANMCGKLKKQNLWLKNYVERASREAEGSNIKMRCQFCDAFSERDWDNI